MFKLSLNASILYLGHPAAQTEKTRINFDLFRDTLGYYLGYSRRNVKITYEDLIFYINFEMNFKNQRTVKPVLTTTPE